MLADRELLLDPELLLLSELLELVLVSPLDVDPLELLPASLLSRPEPAVSEDELPPALDACASSNTLITALLTWPDEVAPRPLELEEFAAPAVESDRVLTAPDVCVVSVGDVLLEVFALSCVKRALAALDELAPVTDIFCS